MTCSSSECMCLCVRLSKFSFRSTLFSSSFNLQCTFALALQWCATFFPSFLYPLIAFPHHGYLSPFGYLLILAHFSLHPLAPFLDGSCCPPSNQLIVWRIFSAACMPYSPCEESRGLLAVVLILLCPSLSVSSVLSRDKMSGSDFSV